MIEFTSSDTVFSRAPNVTVPPSILIVNDEANFILLLDGILSREGYNVTAVLGSNRALYFLDRESFDLAILDIEMYPMSGVELLAEIKRRSPSTQVIMVSGNLTDDIRDECIKLGATAYLRKPFQMSELKSAVRHLTGAQERINDTE